MMFVVFVQVWLIVVVIEIDVEVVAIVKLTSTKKK
jgi:hypothetical protein